jgi:PAS domain S-box-containing protein
VSTSWREPDTAGTSERTQPLGELSHQISGPGGFLASALNGASADLLQALPAAVYTTDAQGRITSYNEAAAELWGCRPDIGNATFCGSWKLYWPDGRPLPHEECPMALALKEKRPIRGMEAVAERPDGSRVPFIPYPTPLFDASGELVGAINMLVDISGRKHVEQSLARHRDEQAALYQFTSRLYRAATLEDIYGAALDAIRQSLGCERASILLFDSAGVMKFVAWWGLSDGYRKAVEGHSPWRADTNVNSADLPSDLRGVVKAEGIRALAFIPLVARGRLIGKFMTYHDAPRKFGDVEKDLSITIARQLGFSIERLRSEEDRRRAEQSSRLLASIIENSSDAIISRDLDGAITSWNRGAARTYGYAAAEMIGKSLSDLIPSDRREHEEAVLARIRMGEAPEPYETVRRRKDGRLIDVSVTVSPMRDDAGNVVGASKIARDITERKRAQARQELLTREIQHRTKNLFAVVHSVVARSFARKETVREAEEAVLSRLHSLAKTHAMLIDKDWQGAELGDVVATEMGPYADRVSANGPRVLLRAKAAQFALATHELATNATKHGALSNGTGRIGIEWQVNEPAGVLIFRWHERGGPAVKPPTTKGFGSAVLEHVMADYFSETPTMNFDPGGVTYQVKCLLSAVGP